MPARGWFTIGVLSTGLVGAVTAHSRRAAQVAVAVQGVTTRMDVRHSMGAVLKGYRTTFGLTQVELATLSGVASTRISRIERGLDTASTVEGFRLADALGLVFRAQFDPQTAGRIRFAMTHTSCTGCIPAGH